MRPESTEHLNKVWALVVHHLTAAKFIAVSAPVVATAAATGVGMELNWNVVLTAIIAAGVSSTISAIASVSVALYLRRPIGEIHTMLNSQKSALEDLQRADSTRADIAEATIKERERADAAKVAEKLDTKS